MEQTETSPTNRINPSRQRTLIAQRMLRSKPVRPATKTTSPPERPAKKPRLSRQVRSHHHPSRKSSRVLGAFSAFCRGKVDLSSAVCSRLIRRNEQLLMKFLLMSGCATSWHAYKKAQAKLSLRPTTSTFLSLLLRVLLSLVKVPRVNNRNIYVPIPFDCAYYSRRLNFDESILSFAPGKLPPKYPRIMEGFQGLRSLQMASTFVRLIVFY